MFIFLALSCLKRTDQAQLLAASFPIFQEPYNKLSRLPEQWTQMNLEEKLAILASALKAMPYSPEQDSALEAYTALRYHDFNRYFKSSIAILGQAAESSKVDIWAHKSFSPESKNEERVFLPNLAQEWVETAQMLVLKSDEVAILEQLAHIHINAAILQIQDLVSPLFPLSNGLTSPPE